MTNANCRIVRPQKGAAQVVPLFGEQLETRAARRHRHAHPIHTLRAGGGTAEQRGGDAEDTPSDVNAAPVDACPLDVRECGDGTFVGRVGPTCAFEECKVPQGGAQPLPVALTVAGGALLVGLALVVVWHRSRTSEPVHERLDEDSAADGTAVPPVPAAASPHAETV